MRLYSRTGQLITSEMRGEQGVEGKTGPNGTSVTASQVLFGASSEIRTEHLEFYIDATAGLIYGSQTIVDASGKANHGILSPSGDVGSIWQTGTTPAKFLRFDGTDDYADFGNILNPNATEDRLFEFWLSVQGANGSFQQFASKGSVPVAQLLGWTLVRSTGNKVVFDFADGSTGLSITSTASLLQDTFAHVAIVYPAAADHQSAMYINSILGGTPSGSPSVDVVGDCSSSIAFKLAAAPPFTDERGQVSIAIVRSYNFGVGGLPSDVATIIARHFNAEKAKFGL